MKKIVMLVAVLTVAAVTVSAQGVTLGGQIGYDYQKVDNGVSSENGSSFSIAPELGFILSENANIGIGLSYEKEDTADIGGTKATTIGGYLFGEYAILNPGAFKVFLRAEAGYDSMDIDAADDKLNSFNIGILPNIQYALSDRLTLIVSSDVLKLGFDYAKQGDAKRTDFGFNAGNGDVVAVGLKYAF